MSQLAFIVTVSEVAFVRQCWYCRESCVLKTVVLISNFVFDKATSPTHVSTVLFSDKNFAVY